MITFNYLEVREYRKVLNQLIIAEFARLNITYQQLLRQVFTELVNGTPQWSGDLAANWNFSVNAPDYSYTETPMKGQAAELHSRFEPRHAGDQEAVRMSLARMEAVIDKVSWRDRVHFTNATPIAEAVENQTIYIRPVNLLESGGVAMLSHIRYKYGYLT